MKAPKDGWPEVPKRNKTEDNPPRKLMKKETLILDITCQYAEKSTAHGISYIFEQDRLPGERLLWTFIVIAGLSFR